MVKTATSVGIEWERYAKGLLNANDWNALVEGVKAESSHVDIPAYYTAKFHGYANGNLCLEAAVEQEIAGKAVGARNFPAEGVRLLLRFLF